MEIWLIDESDLHLYRKIHNDMEEIIPIQGNKDLRKFMCFDGEYLHDVVEGE